MKNFENTCRLRGGGPFCEMSQQSDHHAAVASAAHIPSIQPTVLQHAICEAFSPSSVIATPSLTTCAFSESMSSSAETGDSVAADVVDAADADADADVAVAAVDNDDDGGHDEEIAAGMSPFVGGAGILITFLELDFFKPNCFLGLHAVYTLIPRTTLSSFHPCFSSQGVSAT